MTQPNSFSFIPAKLTMIFGALIGVTAMVLILIFGINPNRPHEGEAGATVYPSSLAALATGCGDYFRWDTEPVKHYAYITEDEKKKLKILPQPPMNIPAYGYMTEFPLAQSDTNKFFTPDDLGNEEIPITTILRTMFDYGTTIIWYNPLNDIVALDVRAYVSEHENVMGVPWIYEERYIPLDRDVAFSSWGITQSCKSFSYATANDFIEFTHEFPVAREDVPPHAKITLNGQVVPMLHIGPYTSSEYIDRLSSK